MKRKTRDVERTASQGAIHLRGMSSLHLVLHSRIGKSVSDLCVEELALRRRVHQLFVRQFRAVLVLVYRPVSEFDLQNLALFVIPDRL